MIERFLICDEKTITYLDNIEKPEISAEDANQSGRCFIVKVVCRYPVRSSIESSDDDDACDELYEKRKSDEGENTLTIFLYCILWDKILQTFCQTEIIVNTDKSDQIDNGIEKPKITHAESIGEEEFDDIT